jgi:sRNA-binding regulator protein Hfq
MPDAALNLDAQLSADGVGLDGTAESALNGNRKLVRPRLELHRPGRRSSDYALKQSAVPQDGHTSIESTHAEVFYFQKQVQTQTPLVIQMEDGQELEGVIEWYDRCSIKLRLNNRQRALVYKSAIKYIYKAGENAAG